MTTSRAYPTILCGALAACNQIFGLNDPVGFVDAPLLVDAAPLVLGDCLVDTFETFDLALWNVIDPSKFPVTVADEVVLDATAPTTSSNGLATVGFFDLREGSVEVEATDPADQADIEQALEIHAPDGMSGYSLTRDRDQLRYFARLADGGGAGDAISLPAATDPWWRIRIDAAAGMVFFETGPDGILWNVRGLSSIDTSLSMAKVSLRAGVLAANAGDRLAFDNFKLAALCK